MAALVCPICGTRFNADQSRALPFCSPRCRAIDLGRWLDEKYTVPIPPAADEADCGPTPPPPDTADPDSL